MKKLLSFHNQYIKLTPKELPLERKSLFIGIVNEFKGLILLSKRVYISTFCLKHLYDKRTACEYDHLLHYFTELVQSLDSVHHNSQNRMNTFVFHKSIADGNYIVVLEKSKSSGKGNYVLTGYRIRGKELKKFEIIWKREAGTPPSLR